LNEVHFLNKECKAMRHELCKGSWIGLEVDFNVVCECSCHNRKNLETVEV